MVYSAGVRYLEIEDDKAGLTVCEHGESVLPMRGNGDFVTTLLEGLAELFSEFLVLSEYHDHWQWPLSKT
jgi:hypothetical protein